MKDGFRWCPHCAAPHPLKARFCPSTGGLLECAIHVSHAQHPLIGSVLDGRYRIFALLGSGGMGDVFEAEDLTAKRLVALKIVARDGDARARMRLSQEARIVESIKHPNICDVYDVGVTPDGGPYIVFERLFGEPLARTMQRTRKLTVDSTIAIFSQVLAGLHAAHERFIVHRDVKPQNVFIVTRGGRPPVAKVMDFGCARDLSAHASRITRPGRACGTLQYMSPEQLRGEPLDARSDIFSVGVMIYEALTGRHPFACASAVETQANILMSQPRPIHDWRPGLPPQLAGLVMMALSASPFDRPRSALEMLFAFSSVGAALAEDPSLADEPPPSSVTFPLRLAASSSASTGT